MSLLAALYANGRKSGGASGCASHGVPTSAACLPACLGEHGDEGALIFPGFEVRRANLGGRHQSTDDVAVVVGCMEVTGLVQHTLEALGVTPRAVSLSPRLRARRDVRPKGKAPID